MLVFIKLLVNEKAMSKQMRYEWDTELPLHLTTDFLCQN